MILVDFSQIMFGQIHSDLSRNGNNEVSIDLVRHLALNQIRSYNMKYKNKYGQLVLCMDSRHGYWRRDMFKWYKWRRGQTRDDDDLDWDALFEIMNQIRSEIIEQVPFMCLMVEKMEADDLIGVLVKHFRNEKHIIVSGDGDFKQLQVFPNVDQYSPLQKKFLREKEPTRYLFEHIIRGDNGDGIPNIYAPEDFFPRKVEGELKRQPSVFAKKVDELWQAASSGTDIESLLDKHELKRWKLNKTLIDLINGIPQEHVDKILSEFEVQKKEQSEQSYNLYKFFFNNRLRNLMACLGDFTNDNKLPGESDLTMEDVILSWSEVIESIPDEGVKSTDTVDEDNSPLRKFFK